MNKNKRNLMIAVIGSFAILTVAGLMFSHLYKNHLTNQAIIDECFEDFDETGKVVVEKDGLFSQVSCEKH